MNNKERHYLNKELLGPSGDYNITDEDLIQRLINNLIKALYIPKEGDIMRLVDEKRLEVFSISNQEPINWGDLSCTEVYYNSEKDLFIAIVEEAEPKACQTFCGYIERLMISYGWKVQVQTEW